MTSEGRQALLEETCAAFTATPLWNLTTSGRQRQPHSFGFCSYSRIVWSDQAAAARIEDYLTQVQLKGQAITDAARREAGRMPSGLRPRFQPYFFEKVSTVCSGGG